MKTTIIAIGFIACLVVHSQQRQTPIAQIDAVYGIVKFRQPENAVSNWVTIASSRDHKGYHVGNPVPLEEPVWLHNGAQVWSGTESSAHGRFVESGTAIKVPPMSSIKVGKDSECDRFNLLRGVIRMLRRGKGRPWCVEAGRVKGGISGSELIMELAENGDVSVFVIEGIAELSAEGSPEGVVVGGGKGVKFNDGESRFEELNPLEIGRLIQYFAYYPGIVYLPDLQLSPASLAALKNSISRYEHGDLLGGLRNFPIRDDLEIGLNDVRDPAALVKRLQMIEDPFVEFIQSEVGANVIEGVIAEIATGSRRGPELVSFIGDLNQLLNGDSLYHESRFSKTNLSPPTFQLLSENGGDDHTKLLNRRLIGDGFSRSLRPHSDRKQRSSAGEMLYFSGVNASAGNFQEALDELNAAEFLPLSDSKERVLLAIRKLIASTRGARSDLSRDPEPTLATEWLAESYYQQSLSGAESDKLAAVGWRIEAYGDAQSALKRAREAAQKAVDTAPEFSFARIRLAEMHFSFGEIERMETELNEVSEVHLHHNPQALVLEGFAKLANQDAKQASHLFARALEVDPKQGNAWLGLGLARMLDVESSHFSFAKFVSKAQVRERLGKVLGELEAAVEHEPNRALLRSYLGKLYWAYSRTIREDHYSATEALEELKIAQELDEHDPTPWLYSSIIHREQNRINEGILDLHDSISRNDNRQVFRSRLLLDQDLAVRSANLANVYLDAGMDEVSVREAARSVTIDYSNPSAHLFLADSYNGLRDPTRFNLRHETVWFNEFLLGNILAPVGATSLSQQLSQQEYSSLFRSNGVGFQTSSDYRSDGQFRQNFSQYGNNANTAYSIDGEYYYQDGVQANDEVRRFELYATLKHQLTRKDSILLMGKIQEFKAGDAFPRTDPADGNRTFEWKDPQYPGIALAAYNREWDHRHRTTFLAGRLAVDPKSSYRGPPWRARRTAVGQPVSDLGREIQTLVELWNKHEVYLSEANHIYSTERNTMTLGGRYQTGTFELSDRFGIPASLAAFPNFDPFDDNDDFSESFYRRSAYAYYTLRPVRRLWLTGGLAVDSVDYPKNFRVAPFEPGRKERSLVSPKGALVWQASDQVTLRGMYAQALGGVSFEDSIRLETTQLAGFPQAFRSIVSEGIVGSVSAPEYELGGLALDLTLDRNTYLGFETSLLESDMDETRGAFEQIGLPVYPTSPISFDQFYQYRERTMGVALNRLIDEEWSVGLGYRYTNSELSYRPSAEGVLLPARNQFDVEGNLHRARQFILYNQSNGFFAKQELDWYVQDNEGYAPGSPEAPGESFPQLNLFVGYRFSRQWAKLTLGVLNLTDEDYRLNPLTPYSLLPRERVYQVRWEMRF